jgi:hypothetical protein
MAELPLTLLDLLENDKERKDLGRRAKDTVQSQTGATARTLEALERLLPQTSDPAPASAHAAHKH